jgi:hypothetical protein
MDICAMINKGNCGPAYSFTVLFEKEDTVVDVVAVIQRYITINRFWSPNLRGDIDDKSVSGGNRGKSVRVIGIVTVLGKKFIEVGVVAGVIAGFVTGVMVDETWRAGGLDFICGSKGSLYSALEEAMRKVVGSNSRWRRRSNIWGKRRVWGGKARCCSMTRSVGRVKGDARGKAERGSGANDGEIFFQGPAVD